MPKSQWKKQHQQEFSDAPAAVEQQPEAKPVHVGNAPGDHRSRGNAADVQDHHHGTVAGTACEETLMIGTVLLIVSLVCFLLGAANIPARVNWVSLGLAFWVLSLLIGGLAHPLLR